ncbi:hypothetical protein L1887_53346 [Cichorium endivia]|nr:hypothetical protein L1887_53346 [Cichorium endivia]
MHLLMERVSHPIALAQPGRLCDAQLRLAVEVVCSDSLGSASGASGRARRARNEHEPRCELQKEVGHRRNAQKRKVSGSAVGRHLHVRIEGSAVDSNIRSGWRRLDAALTRVPYGRKARVHSGLAATTDSARSGQAHLAPALQAPAGGDRWALDFRRFGRPLSTLRSGARAATTVRFIDINRIIVLRTQALFWFAWLPPPPLLQLDAYTLPARASYARYNPRPSLLTWSHACAPASASWAEIEFFAAQGCGRADAPRAADAPNLAARSLELHAARCKVDPRGLCVFGEIALRQVQH